MKKFILPLLFVLFLIVLSSCAKSHKYGCNCEGYGGSGTSYTWDGTISTEESGAVSKCETEADEQGNSAGQNWHCTATLIPD